MCFGVFSLPLQFSYFPPKLGWKILSELVQLPPVLCLNMAAAAAKVHRRANAATWIARQGLFTVISAVSGMRVSATSLPLMGSRFRGNDGVGSGGFTEIDGNAYSSTLGGLLYSLVQLIHAANLHSSRFSARFEIALSPNLQPSRHFNRSSPGRSAQPSMHFFLLLDQLPFRVNVLTHFNLGASATLIR